MKIGKKQLTTRLGFPRVFTALALALAMLILPSARGLADTIDVTKAVSLTVYPGGGADTEESADDIDSADIVIDLYKIADAKEIDGYDTYEFVANEAYGSLSGDGDISINNKNITNDQWRELSQRAAAIALGTASGASARTPEVKGEAIESKLSELSQGLYLVIARGSTISSDEYIKTSDNGNIATIARTSRYEYTFEPELVALPIKDAEGGVINTANSGDWVYDASIYLKFAVKPRSDEGSTTAATTETTTETSTATSTSTSTSTGKRSTVVKTGDDNNMILYIIIAGMGGLFLLAFAVYDVRKRRKGN